MLLFLFEGVNLTILGAGKYFTFSPFSLALFTNPSNIILQYLKLEGLLYVPARISYKLGLKKEKKKINDQ
jgi:hypothetical protein